MKKILYSILFLFCTFFVGLQGAASQRSKGNSETESIIMSEAQNQAKSLKSAIDSGNVETIKKSLKSFKDIPLKDEVIKKVLNTKKIVVSDGERSQSYDPLAYLQQINKTNMLAGFDPVWSFFNDQQIGKALKIAIDNDDAQIINSMLKGMNQDLKEGLLTKKSLTFIKSSSTFDSFDGNTPLGYAKEEKKPNAIGALTTVMKELGIKTDGVFSSGEASSESSSASEKGKATGEGIALREAIELNDAENLKNVLSQMGEEKYKNLLNIVLVKQGSVGYTPLQFLENKKKTDCLAGFSDVWGFFNENEIRRALKIAIESGQTSVVHDICAKMHSDYKFDVILLSHDLFKKSDIVAKLGAYFLSDPARTPLDYAKEEKKGDAIIKELEAAEKAVREARLSAVSSSSLPAGGSVDSSSSSFAINLGKFDGKVKGIETTSEGASVKSRLETHQRRKSVGSARGMPEETPSAFKLPIQPPQTTIAKGKSAVEEASVKNQLMSGAFNALSESFQYKRPLTQDNIEQAIKEMQEKCQPYLSRGEE